MPNDDELDISSLADLRDQVEDPHQGPDGTDAAEISTEEARDLLFDSCQLPTEEHAKEAAVRLDAAMGEMVALQERTTVAVEAIATVAGALADVLDRLIPWIPDAVDATAARPGA